MLKNFNRLAALLLVIEYKYSFPTFLLMNPGDFCIGRVVKNPDPEFSSNPY